MQDLDFDFKKTTLGELFLFCGPQKNLISRHKPRDFFRLIVFPYEMVGINELSINIILYIPFFLKRIRLVNQ